LQHDTRPGRQAGPEAHVRRLAGHEVSRVSTGHTAPTNVPVVAAAPTSPTPAARNSRRFITTILPIPSSGRIPRSLATIGTGARSPRSRSRDAHVELAPTLKEVEAEIGSLERLPCRQRVSAPANRDSCLKAPGGVATVDAATHGSPRKMWP
jgi:hypothetical protein